MKLPRLPVLIPISITLVGLALWVHLGDPADAYTPQVMTSEELAALKPDLDGDMRLLTELRRQVGYEPGAWRDLPPVGQTVFLTLWAEEQNRTIPWPQLATLEALEGQPSLSEVAEAYDTLALPRTAAAVRTLAGALDASRTAFAAWSAARQAGRDAPPPDCHHLEATARAAFSGLQEARTKRLELARNAAKELGLEP
jgi:hypothetical protein